MTRFGTTFTIFTAAAAALLAPTLAHADGGIYQCAPNDPGGVVLTCIPAEGQIAQSAQAPAAPFTAPTERTLTGRTHNWLAPTGEMLRGGDAQLNLHQFVYADAAIALNDNLEINFTLPLLPVFASVGGRVGLTAPESPLKLVLGGAVYFPLIADEGADTVHVLQVTGTAAYSTPTLNLHASLSLLGASAENDEATVVLVNVGGTFKIGRKTALMVELAHVGASDGDEYMDAFRMSAVGIKFIGASTDVDLGVWIPSLSGEEDDGEMIALPMLSMSYKF